MELSYVLNQQISHVSDVISFVMYLLISFLNLIFKLNLETSEKAFKFQNENIFAGIISSEKVFSILTSKIKSQNHLEKERTKFFQRLILG